MAQVIKRKSDKSNAESIALVSLLASIISAGFTAETYYHTFGVDNGTVKASIQFEGGSANASSNNITVTPERMHIVFLNDRRHAVALFSVERAMFGIASMDSKNDLSCPVGLHNTQSLRHLDLPQGGFPTISLPANEIRTIDL